MALPRFIFLRSINNNKYLRYRKEDDSNHAFLQFSQNEKEENPEVQYAKFEVQKSKTVEGFVHIRSCYNNKYWVRKSADSKWIVAEANEPEEDQSMWCCTLFKVVHIDADGDVDDTAAGMAATTADVDVDISQTKPQKIGLVHSDQLGQNACIVRSNTVDLVIGEDSGTTRSSSTEDEEGVFVAYNANSVILLPDRVALIGNNGKYGAVTTVSGVSYLEFKTTDVGHQGVVHQVFQNTFAVPQTINFQNTSFNFSTGEGYWYFRDHFIWLNLVPGTSRLVTVTPFRVGGELLAFRDTRSPFNFVDCGAGPANNMDSVLRLTSTSISESAMFRVAEPVRFRQVRDVKYNLVDSRVHNITSVDKYKDERSNYTSVDQTGSFSVEYTVSQTRTWDDSISVSSSITASMSASIPYVGVSFGVELSQAREQTVAWGNEVSESHTVSYVQEVTIPPMKKITVVVVATQAQCDVPFTCHVVDTVTDGTIREYTKNDGLFTGANEFNFTTRLLEEDL